RQPGDDPSGAGGHGGGDSSGAFVLAVPGLEVEAEEAPWRYEVRGQALDEGDGELAGRQEEERCGPGLRPRGAALALDVREGQGQQGGGDESDRPKVKTGGVREHEAPCAVREARTVGHV